MGIRILEWEQGRRLQRKIILANRETEIRYRLNLFIIAQKIVFNLTRFCVVYFLPLFLIMYLHVQVIEGKKSYTYLYFLLFYPSLFHRFSSGKRKNYCIFLISVKILLQRPFVDIFYRVFLNKSLSSLFSQRLLFKLLKKQLRPSYLSNSGYLRCDYITIHI